MKFIHEESDKNYENKIRAALENGDVSCFIQDSGKYYIEFTATDIPKANAFIAELLKPNNNCTEKELGINVACVAYSNPDRKIKEIKEVLQNAIDQLDRIN